MHTKTTDQELITLFTQHGDKSALGEIFNRHITSVYRFVYSRVGKREWSEDITSEVFFTFMQIAENYNGKSTINTFLTGIAINKIRQFWQKLGQENNQALVENIVIVSTEVGTSNMDGLIKHLDVILNELPENYRQVLEHRFIKGQSIKETAASLNLSSENVRVLQHRALKQATVIAQQFIK